MTRVLARRVHLEPVERRIARSLRAHDGEPELATARAACRVEGRPLADLSLADSLAHVRQVAGRRGLAGEDSRCEGGERDGGHQSSGYAHGVSPRVDDEASNIAPSTFPFFSCRVSPSPRMRPFRA